MKGLFNNRTNRANRVGTKDDAIVSALRFFKTTQNPDGSWGGQDERSLATPLVLRAYFGRFEGSTSTEFSNTVNTAHTWLLNSAPLGTAARLATVIALAGYCDISYSKPQSKESVELARILQLFKQMSPTNNDIWVDFAKFRLQSADHPKPLWFGNSKVTLDRYLAATNNLTPVTVEGYMAMLMTHYAIIDRGGEQWQAFDRAAKMELMKRQLADGSFPVSEGQSRYVATALATLQLEIFYQTEMPVQIESGRQDQTPDLTR